MFTNYSTPHSMVLLRRIIHIFRCLIGTRNMSIVVCIFPLRLLLRHSWHPYTIGYADTLPFRVYDRKPWLSTRGQACCSL